MPAGPPPADVLPRSFYDRPVRAVARELLGAFVCAGGVVVRLTEVEAYDGESDPASHAYRGPTARNAVMFGPPGHAYVYFSYGMHWCANLVCGPAGQAAAVLLRAGEVVAGAEAARGRRPAARAHRDLARGPARLTAALGVDRTFNGADVTDPGGTLVVCARIGTPKVSRGPRVGISAAAGRPWRFWVSGDPTVSAYRAGGGRRRESVS